jgi:hypothetical protein
VSRSQGTVLAKFDSGGSVSLNSGDGTATKRAKV